MLFSIFTPFFFLFKNEEGDSFPFCWASQQVDDERRRMLGTTRFRGPESTVA